MRKAKARVESLTHDLSVRLICMYSMHDWEGELSFGKIFREALI
jgi:hypothetical protein